MAVRCAAVSRSIVVYKDSEDKIIRIDNNKLIGAAGPASDRVHFLEYVEKNVVLYGLRAGHTLSTHATAQFTRNELAEALRKGALPGQPPHRRLRRRRGAFAVLPRLPRRAATASTRARTATRPTSRCRCSTASTTRTARWTRGWR